MTELIYEEQDYDTDSPHDPPAFSDLVNDVEFVLGGPSTDAELAVRETIESMIRRLKSKNHNLQLVMPHSLADNADGSYSHDFYLVADFVDWLETIIDPETAR